MYRSVSLVPDSTRQFSPTAEKLPPHKQESSELPTINFRSSRKSKRSTRQKKKKKTGGFEELRNEI